MKRAYAPVTWSNYRNSDPVQGDTGKSSITGMATNMEGLTDVSYQFSWNASPTASVGTISIQLSNNYDPNDSVPAAVWTTMSADQFYNLTNVQPAGTASNTVIQINDLCTRWVRPVYTQTSGTSTLLAYVMAKGG